MGVGRHVVDARPGALDGHRRSGRVPPSDTHEPVLDERVVDRPRRAPTADWAPASRARAASPRRRKWKPLSNSTVSGRSRGSPSHRPRLDELAHERPDGKVDAELWRRAARTPRPSRGRACPTPARAHRCARGPPRRVAAARVASSRVIAAGSAVPSSAQNTAPSTSSTASPSTRPGSTRSTGTPSDACTSRRRSSSARPASVVARNR